MADVDLRPMTLGEVLDRTFSLYKRNFFLFIGISALPFLVLLLINVGLAGFLTGNVPGGQSGPLPPNFSVTAIAGGFFVIILYIFLTGAVHAATVFAVSDVYLGRVAAVRSCYSRVGTKVFTVLLVIFIIYFLVGISFVFIIIVAALLRSPVIIFLGILLALVPILIFLCRTSVAIQAAMIEDVSATASISRSLELTKGYAMQVFLIFLLVAFLTYAAILIFQAPFLFLATEAQQAHRALSFGVLVLQHLSEFLSQILIAPIGTIAFSLMYYNLRVRKEAFDIQHLMASLGTGAAPGAPSIV